MMERGARGYDGRYAIDKMLRCHMPLINTRYAHTRNAITLFAGVDVIRHCRCHYRIATMFSDELLITPIR